MLRFSVAFGLFLSLATLAGAEELRILTFNTWMLRLGGITAARDLNPRLRIMPTWIADSGADVVTLQEVWTPHIRNFLIRELRERGYEYSAWHHSAFPFGNGLLIVSKFPLAEETDRIAFSSHTEFEELFVRKGAIRTKVLVPGLGWTDFYNSHLGAMEFDRKRNRFKPRHVRNRTRQGLELASWIRESRSEPNLILTADMNVHYEVMDFSAGTDHPRPTGRMPDDYRMFTAHDSELEGGLDLADSAREFAGVNYPQFRTFDTEHNPYAAMGSFGHLPGEVIDYVFVNRRGPWLGARAEMAFSKPVEKSGIFLERFLGDLVKFLTTFRIRHLPMYLSDHYGVLTRLEFRAPSPPAQP